MSPSGPKTTERRPAPLPRLRTLAALAAAALTAACGGVASTADYYDQLGRYYAGIGHMRTETAPADAPYSNEDLIRDFGSIAFHTEFTDAATRLEEKTSSTTLLKWSGEIDYNVIGDAAGPSDEAAIAALTRRISALTGLRFRRVERDPSLLILIANRPIRDAFVGGLVDRGLGSKVQILERWRKEDKFPCVGQINRTIPRDGSKGDLFAVIVIKGETTGLLREACIHEELTQALGLMNDDPSARPSIFNDDQEFALLTEHDEYLLRILYDPRLRDGMTERQGMPIVRRIVAEIRPEGAASGPPPPLAPGG